MTMTMTIINRQRLRLFLIAILGAYACFQEGWLTFPPAQFGFTRATRASAPVTDDEHKQEQRQAQSDGFTWSEEDGCQEWSEPVLMSSEHERVETGLVITLVLAYDANSRRTGASWHKRHLCGNIPSQRAHFIEPHGMDQLLLFGGGFITPSDAAECLGLTKQHSHQSNINTTRVWQNLDGSNLTTEEYTPPSGVGRIFLANYEVPYPQYIVEHPEILKEDQVGRQCQAPPSYIQGTRFYTNEFFHFSILSEYDYWAKIDLDIVFNKTIPFNMLHDMKIRGALFAHTAEYLPLGDPVCAKGITNATSSFVTDMNAKRASGGSSWLNDSSWSNICSAGIPAMEVDADRYYTNFILGDTRFFQSEPVLELARYLTEFQPGFHRYRWTDQVYYHTALGMFLRNFSSRVADYTSLRCFAVQNCWVTGGWRENIDRCQNGGYFLHTKSFWWSEKWNRNVSSSAAAVRHATPYEIPYTNNCTFSMEEYSATLKKRPEGWQTGWQ